MKLKLGTKVLWLQSFAICIFMLQNYIIAVWFTGLFGTTVYASNPLWFMELVPYAMWAMILFTIGLIWNNVLTSKVEAED